MTQKPPKKHSILVKKTKTKPKATPQKKMLKKLNANTMRHTEQLMAARAGATGKLSILKPLADKALEKVKGINKS
jgi:hypothetical protein